MGNFSLMHWLVVAVVALVLFGRGRISETMGDFGKGIKSFKRGLADEEPQQAPPALPAGQPLASPSEGSRTQAATARTDEQ